jgi:type II secretory pathway pseudopilin PulG
MEILVVVAILVVLAGTGGVYYIRYLDGAKRDAAHSQIKVLDDVVQTYYINNNDYPASLDILAQPQGDGARPYLEQNALVDPWGRKYQYAHPGSRNTMTGKPDIWTDGPRPGDQAGQIGNWSKTATTH